ncbi:MAG: 1-phosphofructokinase [Ignavibacteriaceae bacterium]|nr:1-phosphofructokinase [Ignavibacteriaceae bacterium]
MILTVTINPLLERRYFYKQVLFARENRDAKVNLTAGGKGINVSRQLQHLDTESLIFTFTGGTNGKIFADVLRDEKLKFTTIKTKGETRDAVLVIDESIKKYTYCFGENPAITQSESDEFKDKLDKMIKNCEIVVFSGSSPSPLADDIFPFGIKKANEYDKISVCDTYGAHLKDCINAMPTVMHNNVEEIETSLGLNLKSKEEKIAFLDELYSRGVKQSFLTNGKQTAFANNFDYHFEIDPFKVDAVDSTGSGDAFTAGIVYGWFYNLSFEQSVKLAASLGALNSLSLCVCSVAKIDAFELAEKISCNPVGKKMKIVDVTPQ